MCFLWKTKGPRVHCNSFSLSGILSWSKAKRVLWNAGHATLPPDAQKFYLSSWGLVFIWRNCQPQFL